MVKKTTSEALNSILGDILGDSNQTIENKKEENKDKKSKNSEKKSDKQTKKNNVNSKKEKKVEQNKRSEKKSTQNNTKNNRKTENKKDNSSNKKDNSSNKKVEQQPKELFEKTKILKKIKNHEISPAEGYKLIKKLIEDAKEERKSGVVCYNTHWEKTDKKNDINLESSFGHTLLLDKNNDLAMVLRKRQSSVDSNSKVILIKSGNGFRKISNQQYVINPAQQEDYIKVFEDLKEQNINVENILHMWNGYNETTLESELSRNIYSLFYISKAYMQQKLEGDVQLIYLYKAEKEEVKPQSAAVGGFAKCILQENPRFTCRNVCIQKSRDGESIKEEKLVDIIMKEMNNKYKNDINIKYQDDDRYVERYKEFKLPTNNQGSIPLKENGVYIVTGGMGKLGQLVSKYLCEKINGTLIITGRSNINKERKEKIGELEKLGCGVTYIKADISNKQDVKKLMEEVISKYEKIDGVIHCAGVLRDSFVLNKTYKDINSVLEPKVKGALYLKEALSNEKTDFLVLFSSLASIVGNIGQSAYAYGNSFMDHLSLMSKSTDREKEKNLRIISINWPFWKDGGMEIPEKKQRVMYERTGLRGLPTEIGMKTFESILKSDLSSCIVTYGNKEKIRNLFKDDSNKNNIKNTVSNKEQGKNRDFSQEIIEEEIVVYETIEEDTNNEEILIEKTEEYLKQVFEETLKIPKNKMKSESNFQEYGVDSIGVEQFNLRIEKDFSDLSKTLLYEYQTISELSGFMVESHSKELKKLFKLNSSKSRKIKKKISRPVNKKAIINTHNGKNNKVKNINNLNEIKDIAIIGVSGIYPNAKNLEEFWSNLKNSKSCITEIPFDRWDYREHYDPDPQKANEGKSYSKWGGFLADVDKFDPLFFNISPREAETIDPQERLFLEIAWKTFEDAGYTKRQLKEASSQKKGGNVGVFVGVTTNTYSLLGPEEWNKGNYVFPNSQAWSIANRVSYIFDLKGPSMPVDTACSSGLTAIHLACESLKRGECESALVGGVNLYLHPSKYVGMSKLGMLSENGKCHTFGKEANGFVPGEGVGAVYLKPLDDAIADNDHIYAIIKGSSVNHGGYTSGYTVPNPNAQADLILKALEESDINAKTISYIEAHGTGTALGDPIEITGLTKAFSEHTPEKEYCSIGSVKTNIGHLESAAGIAAITKVILQMKHKQLVPSLNSEEINPRINFTDTPFYVQHNLGKWERPAVEVNGIKKKYPRRAGISSFGAGGANSHVILEEYNDLFVNKEENESQSHIITVSAKTKDSLRNYVKEFIDFSQKELNSENKENNQFTISNIAYTLQNGREEMKERLAIIVSSIEELIEKLTSHYNNFDDIDKLYTGSIKNNEELLNIFLDGKTGDEFKANIIQNRELEKIAKLWIKGVNIDWNSLYSEDTPRRISLPTYQFSKHKIWIPISNEVRKIENIHNKSIGKYPMVDRDESTANEKIFIKSFTGKEFFIEDHLNLVPAVAYLEMARTAGDLARDDFKVKKIENIVLSNPIVIKESDRNVYIKLKPDNLSAQFQVFTQDSLQKRTGHSQGKIGYSNSSEGQIELESINVNKVIRRCEGGKDRALEYYNRLDTLGASFGPRFRGIKEFYFNEEEALVKIDIPKELEIDIDKYILHPTLTDGGLQAVVAWAYKTGAKLDKIYLPFVIGELEILDRSKRVCYAYVTLEGNQYINGERLTKYKVKYLDENGHVVLKLKDYTIREFQPSIGREIIDRNDNTTPVYYTSEWEKRELLDINNDKQLENIMILDNDYEVFNQATSKLGRDRVVLVRIGENFKQIDEKIYQINPVNLEDYRILFDSLKKQNLIPKNIIHLWSEEGDTNNKKVLKTQLNLGIYSMFNLSKVIIEEKTKSKVVYIYSSEKYSFQPQYSALSGFVRTAILENKDCKYKVIYLKTNGTIKEVKKSKNILEIALKELSTYVEGDIEFKYEGKERFVKCSKEVNLVKEVNNSDNFKNGKVYMITGGTGGIGLILAEHLYKTYDAKLILVGRAELNNNKKNEIQRLKDMGCNIRYIRGDISSEEDVKELVKKSKNHFKEINGVIHCAGTIRDSFLIKKTKEEVDTVLAPKVYGTINLDKALKGEKLDLFVMFSSIAALGSSGQSDYAYANSFMDNYALKMQSENPSCRTLSINWPLWKDGGMQVDDNVKSLMYNRSGLKPMDKEIGLYVFDKVITSSLNQFIVTVGDRDKIQRAFDSKQNQPNKKDTKAFISQQKNKGDESITNRFEQDLLSIICDILKVTEEMIELDGNMSDFGFDSISFTELANEINGKFKLDITPAIFFGHMSLGDIIEYLFKENNEAINGYYQDIPDEYTEKSFNIEETLQFREVDFDDIQITPDVTFKNNIKKEKAHNDQEGYQPIAIVGMSGTMPQSEDLEAFWNNLEEGKDLVTEIPSTRWNWKDYYGDPTKDSTKSNSKWGGFMKEVDKFDALFFNISPLDTELMDPQERMILETTWKCIEDAGYKASDLSGTNTGIFVGVSNADYAELLARSNVPTIMTHSMLTNRVSYALDLCGPSEPVDTACSSSLVAIHRAVEAIQLGNCDMALTGGINVILSPSIYVFESSAGMLSPDGSCKTFDKSANGYVRGEGVGMILLKSLSKAEEDGDHIYGIIKGSAVNHGGHATALTAPNSTAQSNVIVEAYEKAKINPKTVSYIEAHGTGTSLGDPIEIDGLKKAFNELYEKWDEDMGNTKRTLIGSVKTNIGHLESASGIAGVQKVLLSMKHNKIPSIVHFNELNPYIKLDGTPFDIVTKSRLWENQRDNYNNVIPKRAGISSFGIGGVNAHIVIEEYLGNKESIKKYDNSSYIIVLSAKNSQRLKASVNNLINYLEVDNISEKQNDKGLKLYKNVANELYGIVANIMDVNQRDIDEGEELSQIFDDIVAISKLADEVSSKWMIDTNASDFVDCYSVETITDNLCKKYREELSNYYGGEEEDKYTQNTINNTEIANIAYTLQVGRMEMEERLAFVVNNLDELIYKLKGYYDGKEQIGSLYINNIKKGKLNRNNSLDNIHDKAYVSQLINNKDYEKLAELWVMGTEINWAKLYAGYSPKRISLPSYPFERERYWIPESEENTKTVVETASLYPLIERNTSTLKEQRFTSTMTGDEYFLEDHVVDGRKILPGAAYIEMACEAGKLSLENQITSIKDIVWTSPFESNDKHQDINITLFLEDDVLNYEIYSDEDEDMRSVMSKGSLEWEDSEIEQHEIESIDVQKIRERCTMTIRKNEFYKELRSNGLELGTGFQSIKQIHINNEEALAEIVLPDKLKSEFDDYIVHPTIIDGALQSVVGLLPNDQLKKGMLYLPFSVDEIEILMSLEDKCYSYVTLADDNRIDNEDIKRFTINIVNLKGEVVVNINNYIIKNFKSKELQNSRGKSNISKKNIDEESQRRISELLEKLEKNELTSEQVNQLMGVL